MAKHVGRPERIDPLSHELDIGEALVFEVCHRFLAGESPTQIAKWLNQQIETEVTREAIYPLIRRAKRDPGVPITVPSDPAK